MILPIKVGVKFVIAAQRRHGTQANSVREKYLRTSVNPYLQHPQHSDVLSVKCMKKIITRPQLTFSLPL